MPELLTVKSSEETITLIGKHFGDLRTPIEILDISKVLGRVCAEQICSGEDVPGFNRTTVDGYAVHAADTFGASESMPAMLKPVNEVQMGKKADFRLNPGECAYVPTGGEIPDGADAMVMVEFCEDYHDGYIYVQKSAAPGSNMVFRGDDVRSGELVLPAGTQLRAQDIGALAALGIRQIKVYCQTRVGIISSGDEVVDIDTKPQGAQIRDVNSWTIRASVEKLGAIAHNYGIVGDNAEKLQQVMQQALQECDVVLISGGSSMGTRDLTQQVIEACGKPGVFIHGIAVKPGKPTLVADVNGKAVFGLPGHPVSAWFIYTLFAAPLIQSLMGETQPIPIRRQAQLSSTLPSNHGREEYVPVQVLNGPDGLEAHPVHGKSGLIMTLVKAQAYIRIPRETEGLAAGEYVDIFEF